MDTRRIETLGDKLYHAMAIDASTLIQPKSEGEIAFLLKKI